MLAIVTFALETQGFSSLTAHNATEAWDLLTSRHIDLAIIDVMLPHASGLELTRRIRSHYPALPIILLTALSDENHRIEGLEAGADDYVTKPFSPRELALRAQAIMRRLAPREINSLITLGPLTIDQDSLRVAWNGRVIPVSETEARLLAALASRPGKIVSHRELLNEVWSTTLSDGGREMIKTTIYRLRKTLDKRGIDPRIIEAHRGEGYRLTF
ncbi:response regulator transcription factor [Arcanobacterium haemolyticum]|nr:response regulator transcription factor [Arcanobacterium haemolyticum]